MLYIIFDILFLLIFGYLNLRFIEVLLKMKQPVLFPTKETFASITLHPDKPLDQPNFSGQKTGIFVYSGMLLFVLVFYILGLIFDVFTFSFYFVLILPFSYSQNMLNLFAITKNGILSGVRFIPWNHIKSFQFIPIDISHKYYGFSKEANTGYELKMKTKGMPISIVVTSPETKQQLKRFLNNYVKDTASV